MISDENLYQRIRSGDLHAFDVLYERYQKQLFRFIYSYLKNQSEAEDLFQEAFMQVLKAAPLEFQEGSFQSWIYRVARNLCLNRIRGQSTHNRWSHQNFNEGLSAGMISSGQDDDSESLFLKQESKTQIQNLLSRLPEEQKEILNLKLSGLGNQSIADALKIPLGTVKSRFNTLVNFMKKELRNEKR